MSQGIHNVKDIVGDALKSSRLLKQGIIKGNWEQIVGKDLGRKTYVAGVKERVLYVNTENPVMLHQLSFVKGNMLEEVNKFLGIDYIKDIMFRVKKRGVEDFFDDEIPEDKFEPNEIKLNSGYKNFIEEETSVIEDPEIRNRIKKIMELSKKKEKFLLDEGNRKCENCGVIFSGSGKICINCYNEQRKKKIAEIYEEIKENPYIVYKDIFKILPDLREEEYEDIRVKIKERVKILMYKEINKDNEDEFRYYARIYFILETGIKDKFEIDRLINYQLLQFE